MRTDFISNRISLPGVTVNIMLLNSKYSLSRMSLNTVFIASSDRQLTVHQIIETDNTAPGGPQKLLLKRFNALTLIREFLGPSPSALSGKNIQKYRW